MYNLFSIWSVGDGMKNQENTDVLPNRINTLFPEHLDWIKLQLKHGKFMKMQGRDILVKAPAPSTGTNIINFPNKGEVGFINALIKVYNCALDYLEGSLNSACLENRFIRFIDNKWVLNGSPIVWPKFDLKNAEYAKGLESILSEYYLTKNQYSSSYNKNQDLLSVKKSSVMLNPAYTVNVPRDIKEKENADSKSADIAVAMKEERNDSFDEDNKLSIQKISDGDVLDARDIESFKKQKADMIVITCQDVNSSKEEDIFVRNAIKCQSENFNVGAFIYGKASDEHMGAIELKRMLKLFDKFGDNFSKLVIYSIDNDYVKKNRNSDIKLLDFINMYNSIVNALKQAGYNVMISMDLTSGKIIADLNNRFNMQNECEIIYMAVVRDADEVNANASSIIVDPGNDYDVVNIRNREILKQISDNINEKSLAKVA